MAGTRKKRSSAKSDGDDTEHIVEDVPSAAEEEDSKKSAKRVKIVVEDQAEEQQEEQETKPEETAAATGDDEEENGEPAEEPGVPLDPRAKEIAELEKEFGEDQEEFEVVIGPVNTVQNTDAPSAEGQTSQQPKRSENLPAFRFSGSSLTASLWLPITPEQEEAMRVTGVTPLNYAHMLNPGRAAKRRTVLEDDLDEIEHPKWRDPGAVQSDFFNYGLNEQTWKEYAARQVALRLYRLQNLQQGHTGEFSQHEDEYQPQQ